jgi:hypothetical protein
MSKSFEKMEAAMDRRLEKIDARLDKMGTQLNVGLVLSGIAVCVCVLPRKQK